MEPQNPPNEAPGRLSEKFTSDRFWALLEMANRDFGCIASTRDFGWLLELRRVRSRCWLVDVKIPPAPLLLLLPELGRLGTPIRLGSKPTSYILFYIPHFLLGLLGVDHIPSQRSALKPPGFQPSYLYHSCNPSTPPLTGSTGSEPSTPERGPALGRR